LPAIRPPLRGGLPGFRMRPAVIDRFCPGGEQPVQLADAGDVPAAALGGVAGDLDQELLADGEGRVG
jgi:hypothetical protein